MFMHSSRRFGQYNLMDDANVLSPGLSYLGYEQKPGKWLTTQES